MSTVFAVFAFFADVYFLDVLFELKKHIGKNAKTARSAKTAETAWAAGANLREVMRFLA